ncbi:hypothetical protein [Embleya sp. NPDC005971]
MRRIAVLLAASLIGLAGAIVPASAQANEESTKTITLGGERFVVPKSADRDGGARVKVPAETLSKMRREAAPAGSARSADGGTLWYRALSRSNTQVWGDWKLSNDVLNPGYVGNAGNNDPIVAVQFLWYQHPPFGYNLGLRGHWSDFGYGSIFPLSFDDNNADASVVMYTPLLQPLEELAFFNSGPNSVVAAGHIQDVGWQGGTYFQPESGYPWGWPWVGAYWIGSTGQARWIEAFWVDTV